MRAAKATAGSLVRREVRHIPREKSVSRPQRFILSWPEFSPASTEFVLQYSLSDNNNDDDNDDDNNDNNSCEMAEKSVAYFLVLSIVSLILVTIIYELL